MSASIATCEIKKSYKIQTSTRFFPANKGAKWQAISFPERAVWHWIRVNLNSRIFFIQLDTDVRYEVISLWGGRGIPPTPPTAIKLFYSCHIDRKELKPVDNHQSSFDDFNFPYRHRFRFSSLGTPIKNLPLHGHNEMNSCRLTFYKLIMKEFYF